MTHLDESGLNGGEFERSLIDSIGAGIATWTCHDSPPRVRFTVWNRQMVALTGYTLHEVNAPDWIGRVNASTEDRDAWRRALGGGGENVGDCPTEARVVRKDGEVRILSVATTVMADREPPIFVGVVTDVTDHKRTEAALRESEARYEMTSEMTRSVTIGLRCRADGRIVLEWTRPRYGMLSGFSAEEVATLGWANLVYPDDRPIVADFIRRMLAGEIVRGEVRYLTKSQGVITMLFHGKRLAAGPVPGEAFLLGALIDITSLKASEEALRQSEEALKEAQALAQVGSWRFDAASGLGVCSDEGNRIFGWGSGPHDLDEMTARTHPEDVPLIAAAWAETLAGRPAPVEYRLVVDGQTKWVAARASHQHDPITGSDIISGVTQDITARRKLEGEFQQAQKMDAIGQLAGGVAHDFNNLLTVINGSVELMLGDRDAGGPARDDLMQIKDAGERAASLTQQLLAFSRRQILSARTLDLNEVVSQSVRMLRRLIGENIQIALELAPALPLVKADPGQLQQVILNLLVNARDAMPKGGKVIISTRTVDVGTSETANAASLSPAEWVELTVADTGHGLSDEVKLRLFEPFFTTKGVGKGTGLGLATVYGIVNQSGGSVSAESRDGGGATFRVRLPATVSPAAAQDSSPRGRGPSGTQETILLVEDDDAVRRLAEVALHRRGYVVLAANGGKEALELVRLHPAPIHLLLTDVVMPEMSGRQVADAVKALRPEIPVLFMSGYTDDAVVRHGVFEANDAFLQKPFSPTVLVETVRALLDGQPPETAG